MTAATLLYRLLQLVLGEPPKLVVRAWDGSSAGPAGAPVIVVRSRDAVRRLLRSPGEIGLARAYVTGDLDTEDGLYDVLSTLSLLERRDQASGHGLTPRDRAGMVAAAVRLRAVGRQPPLPPEEVRRLAGRLHTRGRDRSAISHHYDVGNEFYRIVLGESMVYSCAYWTRPDDPAYGLAEAQRDKLDLVCRKLGLRPGLRLLDVGCGWGSLLIHAVKNYDVSAVGVTLSQEQAALARQRVADLGLTDRVEIRLQDYRDVADGPFDAISSVGMAEHVGQQKYLQYAAALRDLLRPGGRLLNHQIARPPGPSSRRPTFIQRYVFPDGELLPLSATVGALEEVGLEVRDVESLREHYARTLRCWVANLESGWDRAVELAGEGRARVWRLYMAGSALSFEAGRIGVNQVLAVRPDADGSSGLPPTRDGWALA